MRAFLAINLPDEVKEKIGRLILELKRVNPSEAFHWVKTENFELTLHFFGELSEEEIEKLQKPLADLFLKHQPLFFQTSGFGFFPNADYPRVLFIGLQNNQSLQTLAQDVKALLRDLRFEVDPRPFQAHITLARIKGPARCRTDKISPPSLSFPVESVELMESTLTPGGPIYKVVHSFPLGQ